MKVATTFLYRLVLISLVATLFSACTAQPEANEFPILPARFADEGPRDPLVAVDAFVDGNDIYVRYQIGDETLYSGGSWADRIALEDIKSRKPQAGPYILPLRYHQAAPWVSPPRDPIVARVLGSQDWVALRRRNGGLTSCWSSWATMFSDQPAETAALKSAIRVGLAASGRG
jgi:hypothetical protein